MTNCVIDGRYKLTWCTYKSLEKKTCPYPYPDIVIMHFDKEMVKKGTFKTIVQVKGRLGQRIPILALMEEGTPQNIFSTLIAGAYDYLEIVKNSKEYKMKIASYTEGRGMFVTKFYGYKEASAEFSKARKKTTYDPLNKKE